jgi:signal recognition particle GTPase
MATTATTARKTNATKRSTAAKKAAQTRSANQAAEARKRTTAAKKAAETRRELAKTPVDRVQEYAERAALVQLGAALVARDVVTEAVDSIVGTLGSRDQAEKELQVRRRRLQAELKRFERRGSTARTRIEREAKKTRTRVQRDLKARRTDFTKATKPLATQADLVTSRVENLVQTGLTAGQKAATTVQERVAARV